MRVDLRVKHDVETRRLAAALFADGLGCAAVARRYEQDIKIESPCCMHIRGLGRQ